MSFLQQHVGSRLQEAGFQYGSCFSLPLVVLKDSGDLSYLHRQLSPCVSSRELYGAVTTDNPKII